MLGYNPKKEKPCPLGRKTGLAERVRKRKQNIVKGGVLCPLYFVLDNVFLPKGQGFSFLCV
jgi:hypothetical protein